MTKLIKVIAAVALAAIGQTLFAYNGGYENSSLTDIIIGNVTYKGYGNNTVTKRTESGTTIAANAYAQCSKLTSVSLANVTSIDNAAFAYSALTSVELPATLKTIGYIPFGGCKSLASVTINSTAFMTSADEAKEPFRDCTALKTVKAKCAPPTWDFKKVFPSVTTVRVPKAILSTWQAKKYAGVTCVEDGSYKIRFIRNDGAGTMETVELPYGVTTALPTVAKLGFARRGYDFTGWYTSTGNIKADKVWKKDGDKVASPFAVGTTTDVYAGWKLKSDFYEIRFEKNDGTRKWRALGYEYGKSTVLPSHDVGLGWARAGYTFKGWSTSATGKVWKGDKAAVSTAAAKGKTLTVYAIWEKKTAKAVATVSASSDVAQTATGASVSVPDPEVAFVPGYIRGLFADGSGTFDLLLAEDGTAFFRAETEDGVWSAECEAEVVGDALILTLEAYGSIVIRGENGMLIAE